MAGTQEEFERILDSCLDRLQSGEATLETILVEYPELADELRPMLETVDWLLAKKASLAPRPDFISTSRLNLVARLQSEQVATGDPPTRSLQPGFFERLRQRLLSFRQPTNRRMVLQLATVLVLLLAMITGGISTAYASQQALPGEVLYPVKLSLEQVELFFSLDDLNDINLHMQFAHLRTHEMDDLVALNRYLYLRDTLANYQYHVNESIRLLRVVADSNLEKAKTIAPEVHRMVVEQPAILKNLAQSVPERVFPGLAMAVQLSEEWVQVMYSLLQDLEIELTPTPGVDNPALPIWTGTATQSSFLAGTLSLIPITSEVIAGTPTSTQTQTPTHTTSPFPLPFRTYTSTPKPGSTRLPPEPTLTFTALLATSTSNPGSTSTLSVSQPVPTATRTLPPTATRTLPPSPTSTSPPTATSTIPPPPTATATIPPPPTATATAPPPPTATQPPYPR